MPDPQHPVPTRSSNPPAMGPDPDGSPLSRRLRANDAPPPAPTPAHEQRELAEKRLGASLKGWRLASLLGVGPVTASYEALRGNKDAKERAVVRLMIGNVAEHERARSLFVRAAYAANRFNHARVLPVTEDGVDESGAPFVVRPWVEAETLEGRALREPPIEDREAMRIAEQVLDALEMAHAHGIIHGAITPTNVLVTPRGSIRLCDFATPPGLGATRTPDEDLLLSVRKGPYAAPESAEPARADEAPFSATEQSDVYGVGATIYFALAKTPPVRGEGGRVRPLREVAPHVGEALAALVDHALKPDPLLRYESAYAMLGDVRRVMVGRKPKLADAMAPVPSHSLGELPQLPPSSRRIPSSSQAGLRSGGPLSMSTHREQRKRETRGNVLLVLAIALLVGTATFVLVREKMNDARNERFDRAPPTGAASVRDSK